MVNNSFLADEEGQNMSHSQEHSVIITYEKEGKKKNIQREVNLNFGDTFELSRFQFLEDVVCISDMYDVCTFVVHETVDFFSLKGVYFDKPTCIVCANPNTTFILEDCVFLTKNISFCKGNVIVYRPVYEESYDTKCFFSSSPNQIQVSFHDVDSVSLSFCNNEEFRGVCNYFFQDSIENVFIEGNGRKSIIMNQNQAMFKNLIIKDGENITFPDDLKYKDVTIIHSKNIDFGPHIDFESMGVIDSSIKNVEKFGSKNSKAYIGESILSPNQSCDTMSICGKKRDSEEIKQGYFVGENVKDKNLSCSPQIIEWNPNAITKLYSFKKSEMVRDYVDLFYDLPLKKDTTESVVTYIQGNQEVTMTEQQFFPLRSSMIEMKVLNQNECLIYIGKHIDLLHLQNIAFQQWKKVYFVCPRNVTVILDQCTFGEDVTFSNGDVIVRSPKFQNRNQEMVDGNVTFYNMYDIGLILDDQNTEKKNTYTLIGDGKTNLNVTGNASQSTIRTFKENLINTVCLNHVSELNCQINAQEFFIVDSSILVQEDIQFLKWVSSHSTIRNVGNLGNEKSSIEFVHTILEHSSNEEVKLLGHPHRFFVLDILEESKKSRVVAQGDFVGSSFHSSSRLLSLTSLNYCAAEKEQTAFIEKRCIFLRHYIAKVLSQCFHLEKESTILNEQAILQRKK